MSPGLPIAAAPQRLAEALDRTYSDVRVSVADWQPMRERIAAAAAITAPIRRRSRPMKSPRRRSFSIGWPTTISPFSACANIASRRSPAKVPPNFDAVGDSGLGILRDPAVKVLRRGRDLVTITPESPRIPARAACPHHHQGQCEVARAPPRAYGLYRHQAVFSPRGELEGELRLVGLFTASAYTRSTLTIPYIRHKVTSVLTAASLDPHSHSGKILANVLETFPRDELFQVDAQTLNDFVERSRRFTNVRAYAFSTRFDRFDRFVSVLTFIPRDRYDTRRAPAESAIISRVSSKAASRQSIRTIRKGRWCARIISSAAMRATRRT